jgi:hypothetical protein
MFFYGRFPSDAGPARLTAASTGRIPDTAIFALSHFD